MEPIQKVLRLLEERGFSLNSADAIELFGRKGDWHTKYYVDRVSTLEVWEINPDFLADLKINLPMAKIKITDSFKEIKKTSSKYNLIIIDNPQSVYGGGKYCEHFELFPHIFRIAKGPCVIILNVNIQPYNFHKGLVWWERRKIFYHTDDPEKLSFKHVEAHYAEICKVNGFYLK